MPNRYPTVTIASGQTVSAAIDLTEYTLVGIIMPSTFTGTTMTFQASADNSTFVAMKDTSGSTISYTVGTSRYIPLDPSIFAGIRFLKLVSGSSEGQDDIIALAVRPV
jgi:hypothetical protein